MSAQMEFLLFEPPPFLNQLSCIQPEKARPCSDAPKLVHDQLVVHYQIRGFVSCVLVPTEEIQGIFKVCELRKMCEQTKPATHSR